MWEKVPPIVPIDLEIPPLQHALRHPPRVLARSIRRPMRLPRRPATACLLVLAAVTFGGCGGSDEDPSAGDPAASMPVRTGLYAELVVRPDGSQRADAQAFARRLLRTGQPGARLAELFEALWTGRDFERDVEPWLGERAGVGVIGYTGRRLQTILSVSARDPERARETLERLFPAERRHAGETFRYDQQRGIAAAVLGGAVVTGDREALQAAIDARANGALSQARDFLDARRSLGGDAGFAYADPTGVLDLLTGAGSADQDGALALRSIFGGSGLRPVAAGIDVEGDVLRAEAGSLGARAPVPRGDPGGAAEGAPEGSVLALGVGESGATLEGLLRQIAQGGALGTAGIDALLDSVRQRSGLDVRADVLPWMGDATFFLKPVAPDGPLGGALLIRSRDGRASRAAVPRLARLLGAMGVRVRRHRGGGISAPVGWLPARLEVLATEDRFVVGWGAGMLAQALDETDRLGETPVYQAAVARLESGAEPAFFLDIPALVTRLDARWEADPDWRVLRPVLDAFGPLAGGARRRGKTARAVLAAGVR